MLYIERLTRGNMQKTLLREGCVLQTVIIIKKYKTLGVMLPRVLDTIYWARNNKQLAFVQTVYLFSASTERLSLPDLRIMVII
ncbi:hypothetical protein EFU51_18725 [Vibrio cholerae]|nr:hypothetical protein [Vibrio cholerae]